MVYPLENCAIDLASLEYLRYHNAIISIYTVYTNDFALGLIFYISAAKYSPGEGPAMYITNIRRKISVHSYTIEG